MPEVNKVPASEEFELDLPRRMLAVFGRVDGLEHEPRQSQNRRESIQACTVAHAVVEESERRQFAVEHDPRLTDAGKDEELQRVREELSKRLDDAQAVVDKCAGRNSEAYSALAGGTETLSTEEKLLRQIRAAEIRSAVFARGDEDEVAQIVEDALERGEFVVAEAVLSAPSFMFPASRVKVDGRDRFAELRERHLAARNPQAAARVADDRDWVARARHDVRAARQMLEEEPAEFSV